jgi:xanthine/uracil permease
MSIIYYWFTVLFAWFLGSALRINSFAEVAAGIGCGISIVLIIFIVISEIQGSFFFEGVGLLIGMFIGSIMTIVCPPKFYDHDTRMVSLGRKNGKIIREDD